MPWVSDSTHAGFIGPEATPAPLEDDPLTDLLHDMVAGIANIPGELIFPRWQPEPPVHPDYDKDWGAVGVMNSSSDWQPSVIHVSGNPDYPDGFDIFQRHEVFGFLVTYYGPNAGKNAGLLRDGLFIDQNLAEFRKYNTTIVEAGDITYPMELFRQRWLSRADLNLTMRREVRRYYPIRDVLRSQGLIHANAPFDSERILEKDWDTAKQTPTPYQKGK